MISFTIYLPSIIKSSAWGARITAIMCMTSCLMTAYILVFIPNKKPNGSESRQRLAMMNEDPRPLHVALPYLNIALSILVALNGYLWRDRKGVHDGFWIICLLPAGTAPSVVCLADDQTFVQGCSLTIFSSHRHHPYGQEDDS
jgi:hypothetical protein